jgi:hypothetical protein
MSAVTAAVEGFRSTKFGMTEADVKVAIANDFGIEGAAVHEQPNAGKRTKVLLIKVADLLLGGGTADISYVFGYKTKKLNQISVSCSISQSGVAQCFEGDDASTMYNRSNQRGPRL